MSKNNSTEKALAKDFCALNLSREDLILFSEGSLTREDVLKFTDEDMEHMAVRISDNEVFETWVECVQQYITDWLIPEKQKAVHRQEGSD